MHQWIEGIRPSILPRHLNDTVQKNDAGERGDALSSGSVPAQAATLTFDERPQKPRVLIVEDNFWVALTISEEITELGCAIVGPASTLSEALALAGTQDLDAALVDIGLGNDNSFPVAHALAARNVPFVFITGRGEPPEVPFATIPVLNKPLAPPDCAAW